MKKITLPCFLFLLTLSFGSTLIAQDTIWGGVGDPISEFAGGLEGWTVNGVSCDLGVDGQNAQWVHSTTGESKGGFSIPDAMINSPSFSNGVALFDSDWLDNGGNPDNINGGSCPFYHRGELISPIIDLSNQDSVVLRFNQFFRWYLGPDGDVDVPPSSVEVSNDGGNTWISFVINDSLGFDVPTPADDVILLDISEVADNQSNVQFKFVFDGDSYFWMIDDVYLLGRVLTSTDDKQLPAGTVRVYPNPADNFTTVDIRLERVQNVIVTLADIHGRVIQHQNVSNIKDHRHTLDLNGLSSGNYFVRVVSPDGISTHTIVVVK